MEVKGTFTIRRLGDLFKGKSERNGEDFELRSLVVSGDVEVGDQVEDVERMELVCFRQGKNDVLFDGMATLYAGSEVELVFTLDWSWMVEVKKGKEHRRLVLKPGRVVGCKVLSRSAAPVQRSATARVAGAFVDVG